MVEGACPRPAVRPDDGLLSRAIAGAPRRAHIGPRDALATGSERGACGLLASGSDRARA